MPSKPRLPRSLTGKIGMTLLYAPIVLPRLLLFSTFVTIAVLGRVLITPVGVVVVAAAVTKDVSLIVASVVLGTLMVKPLFYVWLASRNHVITCLCGCGLARVAQYFVPIINQKLVRIVDWIFLALAFLVLGVSTRDEPVSLRRLGFRYACVFVSP